MLAEDGLMTQLSDPAYSAKAITPSDTQIPATRGVWVGTGGALVVRLHKDDADVTLLNVQDGTLLPIQVIFIRAASVADDIVALY